MTWKRADELEAGDEFFVGGNKRTVVVSVLTKDDADAPDTAHITFTDTGTFTCAPEEQFNVTPVDDAPEAATSFSRRRD